MREDVAHKISIIIEARMPSPRKSVLRNAAEKTLEMEGVRKEVSLNILFTDNTKIALLNRKFLMRDGPTDVIAFGSRNRRCADTSLGGFIGEVVVSVEMARSNARYFNTPVDEEVILYVIHGILHLLGYGDKTKKEAGLIQAKQRKILEHICGKTIL